MKILPEMDDHARRAAEWMLTVTLTYPQPETVTCHASGEIDAYTVPLLVEKLIEAGRAATAYLVIDLSQVKFISSAGLQALVDAHDRQDAAGRGLALVVNSRLRWVMQAIGFDQKFDLYDSLPAALRAGRT